MADFLYADWVIHGGYDTSVQKLFAIACLLLAHDVAAANRDVYMYEGADRTQKLVAGAKKEGQVVLYSTMTVQDGRALGAAFERKYGVRLLHWRGSAEKIVQRALAEARAGHDGADVFETSAHRMEALYREKMLEDFYTPAFKELSPAAFPHGHRQYVAARFAFDHGTSVAAAVSTRSAVTALVLLMLMRIQGVSLGLPHATHARALFVGLLVAIQSFCLYSAVARIPAAVSRERADNWK